MESSSVLLLVLLLVPVVIVAIVILRRRASSIDAPARGDLPLNDVAGRAREFLDQKPTDGSFIVFLTERIGGDGGASQLSIENGKVGIDHVFTAELNRKTSGKFESYLEGQGYQVARLSMNGVDYLRAEVIDAPQVIRSVLQEVLGVSADGKVTVIEEVMC